MTIVHLASDEDEDNADDEPLRPPSFGKGKGSRVMSQALFNTASVRVAKAARPHNRPKRLRPCDLQHIAYREAEKEAMKLKRHIEKRRIDGDSLFNQTTKSTTLFQ